MNGATGPTGPAGAPGVAGIEVVSQNVNVDNLPPGSSNSLTANCPANHIVVAGGFAGTPGVTQGYQSRPWSTLGNGVFDAWRAAYVNPSSVTASGGFTTWAICVPD
jgi:hypothetical protein